MCSNFQLYIAIDFCENAILFVTAGASFSRSAFPIKKAFHCNLFSFQSGLSSLHSTSSSMKKFTLELVFHIIGIGSASGLFYQNDLLYLIGDSSSYLYEYNVKNSNLAKYPLLQNPADNIEKISKPDFESITHYQDSLYIFGSGSTSNRNRMIEFSLPQKEKIQTNNMVDIYAIMQSFASIKKTDFNLEGASYDGEFWYFFNRGTNDSNKNTVLTLKAKKLDQEFALMSNDYKLPKLKGVRTSFTDGLIVGDKLYFLAAAENTKSTYDDGEILGSIIGRIDIESMKVDFTKTISTTNKFEGLTVYKQNGKQITFLLCEDKDNNENESDVFKLTLDLK